MQETPNREKLEITVNGKPMSVEPGQSVFDLLEQLGLNQRGIAVELNEQILPRSLHATRVVAAGDWFEIVTLVGGG
jgi:sulfur carrier protein